MGPSSFLSRRGFWLCGLLGLLLILPSLTAGFFLDDYVQIAHLEGWSPAGPGPFDLFSFLPRDLALQEKWRAEGVLPYFAAPDWCFATSRCRAACARPCRC